MSVDGGLSLPIISRGFSRASRAFLERFFKRGDNPGHFFYLRIAYNTIVVIESRRAEQTAFLSLEVRKREKTTKWDVR